MVQVSFGCFKNSGLLRSLLSGQCFTFVLFYKWELFALLLRCVLIFTEARVLCIAAFSYVCFVKTAGIMAASYFCSFSASDGGYLWTAAFLELLICIDQPALAVFISFMPCLFSCRWLLSEVSAFGVAEEQTHRDLCVSIFEQLFSSMLSCVWSQNKSFVCIYFSAHCPCTLLQPGTNGDTVLQIKIKRVQSSENCTRDFLH